MKTHIMLFLILAGTMIPCHGQTVPNGSFEDWEIRVLYEEPISWTTGNMLSFLFDQTVASRTTDSYQGDLALRLDTRITDETIPGFAFSDGMITTGNLEDGFQFTGGFPVSGTPDQLSGFFKYSIPFPDVGLILVSFKKDGAAVGQSIYPLLFSSSVYTRIDIPIGTLSDVPDSAFIGLATTNPDDPRYGGWIQVDSLWFSGIPDTIPNGNFEYWEDAAYFEPSQWMSSNLFVYLFGGDTSATRTGDAWEGDYAIRIESVATIIPDDDGMVNANMGYLMPYAETVDLNESMPAFPVDMNPSGLNGYYKFFPAGNDTALIIAILTDVSGTEYETRLHLPPVEAYTEFILNFDYPYGVMIDQVSIIANTSLYFDPMNTTQDLGAAGSVLYLDALELRNDCSWEAPFTIELLHEPACENDTAILDAGDGWRSVTWSTGDTSRMLHVRVIDITEISAMVTASDSWCFYMDTIWLYPPEGCSVDNEILRSQPELYIYPNPGAGKFHIRFTDGPSENFRLEVFTSTGQLVYSGTAAGHPADEIDLSGLKKGVYFVKVRNSNNFYYKTVQIR